MPYSYVLDFIGGCAFHFQANHVRDLACMLLDSSIPSNTLSGELISNTLTSVQKDNVLIENYKIRRLTPRECFRLMDFPDTFTWPVSDSQAYKQAGNSIVVNVLYKILKNLSI